MGSRFVVLLAADIGAFLAARLLAELAGPGGGAVSRGTGGFVAAGPLASPGAPASTVFWVAMILGLFATGAYSRHRALNTPIRIAAASLLAAVAAVVPLAAVIGLRSAISETSVIAGIVVVTLIFARLGAERFLHAIWPREMGAAPAILVGAPDAAESRMTEAVTAGGGDYRVVEHYQAKAGAIAEPAVVAGTLDRMIDLHQAEALIVTESLPDRHLRELVEAALTAGCRVLCPPRAVEIEGLHPRLVWHRDQPVLEFATPALQLSALITKRVTDVVGSAILLVLISPVVLLIALGIKLDSRGPVIFSQDRAGLGGIRFRMLKFRTMRAGADDEKQDLAHLNHTGDVRLFKIPSDPRVTRFGGFLRRWSLDEIPQFWNVLRGDMSLVGPRPFFESDFAAYEDHHFRRLDTKPGITGLWQVGGRSDLVDFEDVVYLDRRYIEQWSVWLDLSILLRTVPSVMRRTGAY